MQANTPHATAIAYPLGLSNQQTMSNQSISSPHPSLDPNYFSNLGLEQSNFSTTDSIELGNNFFSQLDSMIAAVKVESNALDTMREKLKEVDNLRNQISTFTKRLIDADQTNLNLKANLVKAQEALNELRKQKTEVESNSVSLRQELNRTKDALNKERVARQQLQQEVQQLREQYARLEVLRDNLDREVKTIPALTESNEILKNDISNIRRRYKEEKSTLQKQLKFLESQTTNSDQIKAEVRTLALKLMEISGGSGGNTVTSSTAVTGMMQQQQRYDPQASMMSIQSTSNYNPTVATTNRNSAAITKLSSIHYEEDDDEDEDEIRLNTGDTNDLSEYDQNSFLDDVSQVSATSIDSGLHVNNPPPVQLVPTHYSSNHNSVPKSDGKKKKVKKAVVTSTRQQQHQQQGGLQSSFSLPRI